MDVYKLLPPIADFTGDSRAAGVNMITKAWSPHYSRHEKRDKDTGQWRKRNDEELAKERLGNSITGGDVMAARTRGNGVMEFYGQAFNSADDLAILIFHETSHWVDTAWKSGGFKISDPPSDKFRSEQHAYERAAIFAANLGLNTKFHTDSAKQFKLQADTAVKENLTWDQIPIRYPKWIGRDRPGTLGLAPAESELSPEDEALLQQMIAKAQALAAAQARKQSEIAQRDHDERLKREWITLARRSCDNPGSVSQSELDMLPRQHNREPVDIVKRLTGSCYDRVYWMLYAGDTAEDIRKTSTPTHVASPTPPVPPPVDVESGATFESILPKLQEFARIACTYQGRVPPVKGLFAPRAPYFFSSMRDQAAADDIMAGLSGCQRHLFRRLFDVLRSGNGDQISEKWLTDTVAGAPVAPLPPQGGGYASPPQGGGHISPPQGTNPCQRGDDPFGCQRPHR